MSLNVNEVQAVNAQFNSLIMNTQYNRAGETGSSTGATGAPGTNGAPGATGATGASFTIFSRYNEGLSTTNDRYLTLFEKDVESTENPAKWMVPINGTISDLRIKLTANADAGGAGTTGSYGFTVRQNGSATLVTCTVAGATAIGNNTANTVVCSAGDQISIVADPNDTPDSGLNVYWSLKFTATS